MIFGLLLCYYGVSINNYSPVLSHTKYLKSNVSRDDMTMLSTAVVFRSLPTSPREQPANQRPHTFQLAYFYYRLHQIYYTLIHTNAGFQNSVRLIHTSKVHQIGIHTQSILVVSFIIDDTSEIQRKQTLNQNVICVTIVFANYRSLSIPPIAVGIHV